MSVRVTWRGHEVTEAVRAAAVDGLDESSAELLDLSNADVPVSEWTGGGFLRGTGKAQTDASELRAAVSYDGPSDTPGLPIFVHERMEIQHPTGSAKFLENAMNENRGKLLDIIADKIKRALR